VLLLLLLLLNHYPHITTQQPHNNHKQPILRVADDTAALGRVPVPPSVLPAPHAPLPPTSPAAIDEALQRLDARKQEWVGTSMARRAALLSEVLANAMRLAPQLARAGTSAKGSYEAGDGEDM
jgi:acyl-CoA reductase-like NAD-dependent aldehyde dehydrogenase